MSITTAQRLNYDQLFAQLPAGATLTVSGADLTSTGSKTIGSPGVADATLQTAVTTAAGQFVDRAANQAALITKAQAALAANTTFIGQAKPGTAAAQASQAYDQAVTLSKENTALIRLLLNLLDSTAGT